VLLHWRERLTPRLLGAMRRSVAKRSSMSECASTSTLCFLITGISLRAVSTMMTHIFLAREGRQPEGHLLLHRHSI